MVDIDKQALRNARAQLRAGTTKETVKAVKKRLDALAHADFAPREQA